MPGEGGNRAAVEELSLTGASSSEEKWTLLERGSGRERERVRVQETCWILVRVLHVHVAKLGY